MDGINDIEYRNCKISVGAEIIQGVDGSKRKVFFINHHLSGENLHALSLAEAMRMARLLDIDYLIHTALIQEN